MNTQRDIIPMAPTARPFKGQRTHFIGIGGCGMRGLAALLASEGAIVSGSDRHASPATEYLETVGVRVVIGQRPEDLPASLDRVVVSAAIKDGNPEFRAAIDRGLPVTKYAGLLGEVMRCRCGIAVAGTHGKSTTTALLAYMLTLGGVNPSYVVGGDVPQLGGGSHAGGGTHFVAEACEYDRSFLSLHPKIAGILNVEHDHPDCYPDLESVIEVFAAFASLVPTEGTLIVNGEDRNMPGVIAGVEDRVETFGIDDTAFSWRAAGVQTYRGRCRFDLWYRDRRLGAASMNLAGRHNMMNALAAAAMAWHAGIGPDPILRAMATFTGVGRRMELKGVCRGIAVVDDYAHHPTEIQASLRAVRDTFEPERLWVVFQPHQHSRTRFLLGDFARSFGLADMTLVPDIYFVRDSETEKKAVSAEDLVTEIGRVGGNACYLKTFDEIVTRLAAELRPGDCLVTVGAGSVYEVADRVLARLSEAAGAAGG